MRHMRKSIVLMVVISCLACLCQAQEDVPIDLATIVEVTEQTASLLDKYYVIEEVGKRTHDHILANLRAGEYDNYRSAQEFVSRLESDCRDISNDQHLMIWYDPVRRDRLYAEEGVIDEAEAAKVLTARKNKHQEKNYGFRRLEILEGNIGYMDIRFFSSFEESAPVADAALNFLANTDALIIDLRNCYGGSEFMFLRLSSYFFEGEPILISRFFNKISGDIEEFWTTNDIEGKRMPDRDLYILTSPDTFSAAEEFAYDMKHLERAEIIGERSGGGAHMVELMQIHDSFVINMPFAGAINPITGSNWEGVGVIPHLEVKREEALANAHRRAVKKLGRDTSD